MQLQNSKDPNTCRNMRLLPHRNVAKAGTAIAEYQVGMSA